MAKNAFLAERNPAGGCEIRGYARTGQHAVVDFDQPRMLRLEAGHRAWKGVTQTGDHLENGKVDIRQPAADHVAAAARIACEYSLEVVEEFRQAVADEVRRAPFRFPLLVAVIEIARYGMMRVMNFANEIGDRK